jgi:hypothetical protein
MPAPQCPAVYSRVLPGDQRPEHVRCTYIEGHDAGHSFRTLELTDETEREELARASAVTVAAAPSVVQNLVGSIEDGEMDRFLELILSAAHDRKRARRGVAGFPRVSREGYFRA